MAFDLMSYSATTANQELAAQLLGLPVMVLIAIAVGIVLLKGFALYKAARRKEKGWFWAMMIINSVGVLPAIYLIMRRNKK